jgi:hypothetical protein
MSLTQKQVVLDYLKANKAKGITSWDAIVKFGITRLAHYIHLLRISGYRIRDQYEFNVDNPSHKWKRYYLTKTPSPVTRKK